MITHLFRTKMPAVKQVLAKVDTNAEVFGSSINLCFQALMIVHEQFHSRNITTTPPPPSSSAHNLPVLATYLWPILSYMELNHKCLTSNFVTKSHKSFKPHQTHIVLTHKMHVYMKPFPSLVQSKAVTAKSSHCYRGFSCDSICRAKSVIQLSRSRAMLKKR